MVSDDPAKGLGRAGTEALMVEQTARSSASRRELDLVSPYFVPGGWRRGVSPMARAAA